MTNLELVNYCKGCLGLPYIYATYGQKLTQATLDRSYKEFPGKWTEERYKKAKKEYIGKKVQDCTGLVEGFLMGSTPETFAKYNGKYDFSANGWYDHATEKGKIGTIPEVPGVCVHYSGHMGVYIGNGVVIEARGFDYGVCKTKLSERGWKNWFKIPEIDYICESEAFTAGQRVRIKVGAKYGGAAKGKAVPSRYTDGDVFTVEKVQTNSGQEEALLKELVSWVPLEYLKSAEAEAVKYFPKYTKSSRSIVDALKSLKVDSSFAYRSKVAKANGIKLYVGSAGQNSKMLQKLKSGTLIVP